ncbi:MAG: hypothetical protein QOJ64_1020 [Acidobacteriota bacterium]|jgi:hypothetical protein|nr:hypothetical protein [Acidobacteriota bacterium]
MKEKSSKRTPYTLSAILLLLAMLGVFGNSKTFGYDPPTGYRPRCETIPVGCGSFGCNGLRPNYKCSLYVETPGATCTDGGPCTTDGGSN